MVRLYLYRFKLATLKNQEQKLLMESGSITKSSLLKKLILLRPSAIVRKGIEWTMADSSCYSNDTIFFNFGRIKRKQKDRFDRENRSFYEMLDDDINRVSCFYDSDIQVLAIEKRPLAPPPAIIASYIGKVIAACKDSELVKGSLDADALALLTLTKPQLDSIPDPVDFIDYINMSHKIKSFDVFFSPENTYDYDELLQQPMQSFMAATDGSQSSAGVSNPDGLKKDPIVQLARAAAAHGDDARAKIYTSSSNVLETIKLKKKIGGAYIEIKESLLEKKNEVFDFIKEKYKQIRG